MGNEREYDDRGSLADIAYGGGGVTAPKGPDRWGRPSWHPDYGVDPAKPPQGGMGSPESGYGPGGVNNPAYQNRGAQPQVQDRWGRSPGHPDYNRDPSNPTDTKAPNTSTNTSGWTPNYKLDPVERAGVAQDAFTNWDRALNGKDAKSTKDLFARTIQMPGIGDQNLAEIIGTGPDAMERAERFSRDVLVPRLMANGADVLDVKKDKILIRTAENPDGEWVDIYGNAGAGDVRFYWGSDGSNKAASGYARTIQPLTPGTSGTLPVDPGIREDAYATVAGEPEDRRSLLDLAYLYQPEYR